MEIENGTSRGDGRLENGNEAVANLELNLGYRFAHPQNLLTALRHRSYVHQFKDQETDEHPMADNQRFEFLGDAVLGLAVSTLLYEKFREKKEGVLSRMRAGLVNESRLADIARGLGVPNALFLGRGEETTGGREKNSILADAMEAIVAAVYLDSNFQEALKIVGKLWGDLIDRSSTDDLLKDFKTRLQELTQRTMGRTPEYRLAGSHGPDHARTFEVSLFVDDQEISSGVGGSKKEAEQAAARHALKKLGTPKDPSS